MGLKISSPTRDFIIILQNLKRVFTTSQQAAYYKLEVKNLELAVLDNKYCKRI